MGYAENKNPSIHQPAPENSLKFVRVRNRHLALLGTDSAVAGKTICKAVSSRMYLRGYGLEEPTVGFQ